MRTYVSVRSLCVPLLFTFLAALALPVTAANEARVAEAYGKLPLYFEANRGQTDKDVRFLARGPDYSLYLTAGEAVLVLAPWYRDEKRNACSTSARPQVQQTPVVLRMSLVGAASTPLLTGIEEFRGKANYLVGQDRTTWRTDVPLYAKVRYENVYPGVDLVYYGNQRQLEYDFVIAPGADLQTVVLAFQGAERLEIDAQGELVLHTAAGAIRQHKPIIYQQIDGARRDITGGYVRKGAQQIGFQVDSYDRSRPLVIDPVLSYSTYLGGAGGEYDYGPAGIAVDAAGSAYVIGWTNSTDFPTTANAFQPAHYGGAHDAFVTKLDPTGSTLVYSTYLGGTGLDQGTGIAVDADGNAYVTGRSSSTNFPTTAGAYQTTSGGGYDAFVTKLDATGSALLYSTYLGGSKSEEGHGIAVD